MQTKNTPKPVELQRFTPTIQKRFWEKVKKTAECWLWIGVKMPTGYGRLNVGRKQDGWRLAHRISWTIANGEIPAGKCVLHRCDNPRCVNPNHLFLGTQRDNVSDMHTKGRASGGSFPRNQFARKLTDYETDQIRRLVLNHGMKYSTLAHQYGVGIRTIGRIVRRERLCYR